MVDVLLLVGLAVAVFVGFNIGGSSTGVAFGPAVGSHTVSKLGAATLMSAFFLVGGWTVGRNVIATMGGKIVPSEEFTLVASVGVLFFVGLALLISNLFGVPASTSMTAVGAIAGLGVATETLRESVMFQIVSAWLLAPVIAFWICAVIGRYLYPYLDAWFRLEQSEGPLIEFSRVGSLPYPTVSANATPKQLIVNGLVVGIGCYMAFSAGASNVANAVAPLVGAGAIGESSGVLLAAGATAIGAFTIARRTLDTVGNDLTDLPLLAALIVEVVSASIITFLSELGIPASLAVSATMCIVGLGWGRATRTVRISDAAAAAVKGPDESEERSEMSVGAIAAEPENEVARIGEEDPDVLSASDLFNPSTTARVVGLWIITPSISALASFLLFEYVPL
ncbi:anion permease [Halomicrococcus sp. NG-SE-24]|uniref:inorganic phosphate transporter n=1 Tax=Halomicrococcus sp. NG-SE-24 TaxID=3436928 RepID=UPI003D95697D